MHRFRSMLALIALMPLLLPTASTLHAAQPAARLSLANVLRADGSLDLGRAAGATLDPAGYVLASAPDGAPRFVPAMPAAVGDDQWDDRFGYPGLKYGAVNAIVVDGTQVYVAGSFMEAAALPSANVLRWDGRRWQPLGSLNNAYGSVATVNALILGGDGLYAGGDFVAAGDQLLGGLARWDGTQWQAVGAGQGPKDSSGSATPVRALAWMGGALYVGGSFESIDGVPALNIARYSGGAWSALGTGAGNNYGSGMTGGSVQAITAGPDGLYVGGSFSHAGGTTVNSIARWTGTTWQALGTGMSTQFGSGTVAALAVNGTSVYVGGDFTAAGGVAAQKVARWNTQTSSWTALGAGIPQPTYATVTALGIADNMLYVGGTFTAAGTTSAQNIARWTGTAWQSIGTGAENGTDGAVRAITAGPGGLYIGGGFVEAGTTYANEIARWDGTAWRALGQGIGFSSIPGSLTAVAVDGQGRVYVGGFPTHVAGMPIKNLAMWDGSAWQDVGGGVDNTVYALAVAGDNVYVGGAFTRAGTVSANHIARWNAPSRTWHALSSGINGNVYALTTHGADVYAGGDFSAVGPLSIEKVARWDGAAWSALGGGLDFDSGTVRALAVSEDGQQVVVGGDFSRIYYPNDVTVEVNGVLLWSKADGKWYLLGPQGAVGVKRQSSSGDFGGAVYAVAIIDADVYVGGRFDKAGTAAAAHIARWSSATNSWHALQDSVGGASSPEVRAFSVIGSDLFVGGTFTVAGTATDVGHVARWDSVAQSWSALGSGVGLDEYDDGVNTLATSGAGIYVGGEFVTAGGQPASGIARWGAFAQDATVTPEAGGTLAVADISVTFPPQAVAGPVTLTLTDLFAPPAPAAVGQQVLRAFALDAQNAVGTPVTQFARDYTLRVGYTDADLAALGLQETSLRLAYWDGTRWVDLPGTVQPAANTVTAQADHFTVFALIGTEAVPPEEGYRIYAPLIAR